MLNYICITGNPISGFQFHGPFSSDHAAVDWAEKERRFEIDWHVSVLRKPSAALSAEDRVLVGVVADYFADKEIHHKDGDARNYDINNLEVIKSKSYLDLGQDSADSDSFASSLPGIEPSEIEHLGEN
jgi:hypothetical protein